MFSYVPYVSASSPRECELRRDTPPVLAADTYPAGCWSVQGDHHAHCRRFSRAVRADEAAPCPTLSQRKCVNAFTSPKSFSRFSTSMMDQTSIRRSLIHMITENPAEFSRSFSERVDGSLEFLETRKNAARIAQQRSAHQRGIETLTHLDACLAKGALRDSQRPSRNFLRQCECRVIR